MDLATSMMLLLARAAGGMLSAVVGGASLILFPAMLAAGVPPIVAVASNTTAIIPGNFLAAMADRSQLPAMDRAFIVLLLTSLVPLLLSFGTLLFAYARPIGTWLGRLSFRRGGATLHPNAVASP
jgi:uncharacterized membrane protein YfcA